MSRNETFIFNDVSEEQKKSIQRIANASEREIEELMHLAKKASARGHKNCLEALSHIYEISAKAMCDGSFRRELKHELDRRKEWKTSAKLINCLVRSIMGVSRQTASKYSAVFEQAYQSNVTPSNLSEFVSQKGGLEKAYLEVAKSRNAMGPEVGEQEKGGKKKSATLEVPSSRANRPEGDDEEPATAPAEMSDTNVSDLPAKNKDKTFGAGGSPAIGSNEDFRLGRNWKRLVPGLLTRARKKGKPRTVRVRIRCRLDGTIDFVERLTS